MTRSAELTSRMTDRARRVMDLAERQVRRAGSLTVQPEHVLYSLLEEIDGVAAHVLENFGFQLADLLPSGASDTKADRLRFGSIEWSVDTQRCIERAMEEATTLLHRYIGTEHLLIGVVVSGGETIIERLQQRGVTPDEVREEVWAILGHEL